MSDRGSEKVGDKRKSRFGDEEERSGNKKPATEAKGSVKSGDLSKLTDRIAEVSSVMSGAKTNASEKKTGFRKLILDAQGREIDEFGNLVKHEGPAKTLAANAAQRSANKKKENPYLAHKSSSAVDPEKGAEVEIVVDERIPAHRREIRGKKALSFVEAGTFVKEAEKIKAKEERKLIAGYSSGRKTLEHKLPVLPGQATEQREEGENKETGVAVQQESVLVVPPPQDTILPTMEWWDEAFLPKDIKHNRTVSKVAADNDDFVSLAIAHNKHYKYVQHPVGVKPLGGEKPSVLPMYLTKSERKKLRKATRAQREQEKRDKQMMGLIPAPEPKFTLSNFMKVLGDQAVADPSKVEMKVMQQMQQRILNHEMRNQAAKLTPKERKEKKLRKLQEDTSRSVHVAVFRIRNFNNLKYRFKVDVNAQQHFLTGVVLLSDEGLNIVVAEGGPKGIRKFVKLMTERIRWNDNSCLLNSRSSSALASALHGTHLNGGAGGEDNDSDDEDEEPGKGGGNGEEEAHEGNEQQQKQAGDAEEGDEMNLDSENAAFLNGEQQLALMEDVSDNRCDLLWQGIVPKRTFTGFKFHETKSSIIAKKLLESKGVMQYWDMALKADELLASGDLKTL